MKKRQFVLVGLLLTVVVGISWLSSGRSVQAVPAAQPSLSEGATSEPIQAALQNSPLMFIENVGQFAEGARFQVRGGDRAIWLAEDAIWVTILEPAPARPVRGDVFPPESETEVESRRGVNIRLSFVGANPAPELQAYNPISTTISYFLGNDPEKWRPDVPVWGGVRYRDLYPGLDLELSGTDALQLRLVCRAADCAAALANVTLEVKGAEVLFASGEGLIADTALGSFTLPWLQVVNRNGRTLHAGSGPPIVTGELVRGPLSQEPSARPQVDSPLVNVSSLLYSTFLGGEGEDVAYGITVDAAGNAYVAGFTGSTSFPTTPGAFDTTLNGGDYGDAFVTKLNAAGNVLLYGTFLGGESGDEANGITLDGAGNAYVTGLTRSASFPTTPGAFDTTFNGGGDPYRDVFVTKLNTAGSALLYSTFLGGESDDEAAGISLDGAGSALVTGTTGSLDFPTTSGAFDTIFNGGGDFYGDVFVTKLNAAGSALLYSTFLGGEDGDVAYGITVDSMGNGYVTGYTESTSFPTTPGAFDTTFNGGDRIDAFVTKLSSTGSALLYSTFLGGKSDDGAAGISLDVTGNALVTGTTNSTDFPTTPGAFDTIFNGGGDFYGDAFVTKLNTAGSALLYSTFLGGESDDIALGIALDGGGDVYATGSTRSVGFPTTPGAFDNTYNGGGDVYGDVFVTKLNTAGSALLYSTFLGGQSADGAFSVNADDEGNTLVTGGTGSLDFPTTPGAFDTYFNGNADVFVARLAIGDVVSCPVPYFSQRDPAWINHPLRSGGACSASCSTIGACGCTLTAATMLFAHYGADLTPPQLSDCMGNQACPFSWGTGASCSQGQATWHSRYAFSWSLLEQQLNVFQRPVILGMHREGDADDTHWVLVIGGQGSDPAGYVVHDPWPLNGANTTLSALTRNRYVPDWLSVYDGEATCAMLPTQARVPAVGAQPVLTFPAASDLMVTSHPVLPSQEVTGTVHLYHMTELTMTLQLSASSPFGAITEMQVWTDADPTPVWQPFAEFVWLEWFPEHDAVYVRFRDEFGNMSGNAGDTTHPVNTPAPELPYWDLFLPLTKRAP